MANRHEKINNTFRFYLTPRRLAYETVSWTKKQRKISENVWGRKENTIKRSPIIMTDFSSETPLGQDRMRDTAQNTVQAKIS